MADGSAIEWTDATWSPLLGCSKVSEGCRNCYAIRTSYRAAHLPHTAQLYQGLTVKRADGSLNWTGEVRLVPERLVQPLAWKKPRRIFVNSQSDLFHESVPDDFIDRVFATMAMADHHTYQILTKRPERMAEYMAGDRVEQAVIEAMDDQFDAVPAGKWAWPLPNVWLGTSVEDQRAADERIPHLLATPAAVRFLSCEPLLGPVDLTPWLPSYTVHGSPVMPVETRDALGRLAEAVIAQYGGPSLHWVIAGGESGPGARPMHPDWARSLRDQCAEAGVAFLFKQVGGRTPKAGGRLLDGRLHDEYPASAVPS